MYDWSYLRYFFETFLQKIQHPKFLQAQFFSD